MLLKLKKHTTPEQIVNLARKLEEMGHSPLITQMENQTVIGLEKAGKDLGLLDHVDEAISLGTPYKLVSRAFHPENTVIQIGDVQIGGPEVVLMAGPCAIESVEQLIEAGVALKKAG